MPCRRVAHECAATAFAAMRDGQHVEYRLQHAWVVEGALRLGNVGVHGGEVARGISPMREHAHFLGAARMF